MFGSTHTSTCKHLKEYITTVTLKLKQISADLGPWRSLRVQRIEIVHWK